jgi:proteasome-associated ATPase
MTEQPVPDTPETQEGLQLLRELRAVGPQAPDLATKLDRLQTMRSAHPAMSPALDEALLGDIERLRRGLEHANAGQQELRRLFDRLTAPPWSVGVILGTGSVGSRPSGAVVGDGVARRVVNFAEGVDPAQFSTGDEVLIGPERNLIVARSPYGALSSGETATFDRTAGPDRIVIRSRDEELVVTASARLMHGGLRAGDLVRWDRQHWLAFEKLEATQGTHLFLGATPEETFASVGGLDRQIEELQRSIRLHFAHGDIARRYAVKRCSAVLLAGPPGTGKTLIARALANWLAQLAPSGRSRFLNCPPGSLNSMWFSKSEANYHEAFRVAKDAGAEDPDVPVVLFFDEVDAIGAARTDGAQRVDDRILNAFLSELDGLESRGNVLVVCATNRRDALDPALLRSGGRLGDLILEIPRPDRRATRDIFLRHLPQGIPYAGGQPHAGATRERLVDAAVARIFAPNAAGELATLTFRDGKRRPVTGADLVSGASIANIARKAIERACLREVEGEAPGIDLSDVLEAVDHEFGSAARTLTPGNARRFLDSLPPDIDVVRIDRADSPARRSYRYLSLA